MIKIEITTTDRELIHALWELKTDDITIEKPLHKAGGISDVFVYILVAERTYALIKNIFSDIASRSKKKPRSAKASCYPGKHSAKIREIIASLEDELDVDVQEEE